MRLFHLHMEEEVFEKTDSLLDDRLVQRSL